MYREVGVLAERQGFLSSILEENGDVGTVLWACLTKGGMPCIMAGENIPWF